MDLFKFSEATLFDPVAQSNYCYINSIRYASPIHGHDFYELFLITKGSTAHHVNNEVQQLREGALVFIRPQDVHYYDYEFPDNQKIDCQFFNITYSCKTLNEVFNYFSEAFNPERLLTPLLPPVAMLSSLEKANLIERFEKILIIPENKKQLARIRLKSLLAEMLSQYFNHDSNSLNKECPLWLQSLLTLMQKKENFTEGLNRMYELSDRSVGHLNRSFKQYLNVTPTYYINSLRLNYAKNLLATTKLQILEISMEAGFENLSHFYHTFKKHCNITPTQMRNFNH